jgi:D-xylulose reductase
VFEASRSPKAYDGIFDLVRLGGCLVMIGKPIDPVAFALAAACVKEARIETVFRCANIHAHAIVLIAPAKLI